MLYADIQIATTAATVAAAAVSALSAITVTTCLVATVRFGTRVNGTLGLWAHSLSLNLGQRSHDSILSQGAGHDWNLNGRNLHGMLSVIPRTIQSMLALRNKKFVNHLVAYKLFNIVPKNSVESATYNLSKGSTQWSGMLTQ